MPWPLGLHACEWYCSKFVYLHILQWCFIKFVYQIFCLSARWCQFGYSASVVFYKIFVCLTSTPPPLSHKGIDADVADANLLICSFGWCKFGYSASVVSYQISVCWTPPPPGLHAHEADDMSNVLSVVCLLAPPPLTLHSVLAPRLTCPWVVLYQIGVCTGVWPISLHLCAKWVVLYQVCKHMPCPGPSAYMPVSGVVANLCTYRYFNGVLSNLCTKFLVYLPPPPRNGDGATALIC